jgi:hypothetical protein
LIGLLHNSKTFPTRSETKRRSIRFSIVHKWRHYLDVYDRHLSRFRNSSFKMLEIGVFKGGSMRLWRDYFGSDAVLFGVDIDPECKHLDGIYAQIRIPRSQAMAPHTQACCFPMVF